MPKEAKALAWCMRCDERGEGEASHGRPCPRSIRLAPLSFRDNRGGERRPTIRLRMARTDEVNSKGKLPGSYVLPVPPARSPPPAPNTWRG